MSESAIQVDSVFDFSAQQVGGSDKSLAVYEGQVLLIVNTASECGFTGQYAGLEALFQAYKEKGFIVLGFPCNQFGAQEPGDAAEILSFCQINYGVSFPIFEKIEVNGVNAHPLYTYMKDQAKGVMGTLAIKWNFTKFLIGRDGRVVERFSPQATPDSLHGAIEQLL